MGFIVIVLLYHSDAVAPTKYWLSRQLRLVRPSQASNMGFIVIVLLYHSDVVAPH